MGRVEGTVAEEESPRSEPRYHLRARGVPNAGAQLVVAHDAPVGVVRDKHVLLGVQGHIPGGPKLAHSKSAPAGTWKPH